jgi:uncharacterized LabA/DUF88 family protein
MDETYVFIDGQYLSMISKHFGKGKYLSFDINQFANTLAKSQGLWCKGTFFYTAPPYQSSSPTSDEKLRKSNYDKFISKMKKIPNFVVREGRCQKTDDGFQQKGVDTLLTMDLADISKKNIKTILLIICDTDFVPILNKIRESGIEVILFFYSDFKRNSKFSMSNHLFTACDKYILIELEHFKKSMIKKND